ncbi:hypothetical protein AAFN85_07630 [Mucilaginibacter sp. CAU 1740]|uniref:hypothetical protein n=1 Tax=Mucilaginibacter sp. CAU 1740 TaxID=3140365 RepID=UPI00325C0F34
MALARGQGEDLQRKARPLANGNALIQLAAISAQLAVLKAMYNIEFPNAYYLITF